VILGNDSRAMSVSNVAVACSGLSDRHFAIDQENTWHGKAVGDSRIRERRNRFAVVRQDHPAVHGGPFENFGVGRRG
jgi:hypothetical protein